MSSDRVIYNGAEMSAEWPARIEAAQTIREYVIGGKTYERIPYGAEEGGGEFPEPCHDCGVLRGQYHVERVCDMEECPLCHGQVIGCDCPYERDDRSDAAELREEAQSNASLNWRELLERIEPELSGYTVFLETESGRFLPLASQSQGEEVVGLIISYIRDGLSPWETEQPVKQLAQRLSVRVGLIPTVLLSRSPESFVGYYVRIRS
jgi:hypothetical protein